MCLWITAHLILMRFALFTCCLSSPLAAVFDRCGKMETQHQKFCVAIKFNGVFQYCEIGLSNLTRDSFLNDGNHFDFIFEDYQSFSSQSFSVESVVPKVLSNVELSIYDNRDALIPIHLLKGTIEARMAMKDFYLRIAMTKTLRQSTQAKVKFIPA